jgi:hypothetical protein
VNTKFWWKPLKKIAYLKELVRDGRIILKQISKKKDGRVWTGLIWLRKGTSGGLLSRR